MEPMINTPHPLNARPECLEPRIREYARTRHPRLREQVILDCQPMVRFLAHRFQNAGEPLEDLVQVGNIGLINALDRFAPERGLRFSSYAYPSILGELKRYFRDKALPLKAPRAISDLLLLARRTSEEMTAQRGHAPTVPELARRLGVAEEALLEALEYSRVMYPHSLESPQEASEQTSTLGDTLGAEDAALRDMVGGGRLHEALESLRPREREVVQLRFLETMSQAATAERLGVSQMQVSRLQRRALHRLRETLGVCERGGDAPKPLCCPAPPTA